MADEARALVIAGQFEIVGILAQLDRLDRAVEAFALDTQAIGFGFGKFGHAASTVFAADRFPRQPQRPVSIQIRNRLSGSSQMMPSTR